MHSPIGHRFPPRHAARIAQCTHVSSTRFCPCALRASEQRASSASSASSSSERALEEGQSATSIVDLQRRTDGASTGPVASITRIFLIGQPQFLRTLASRKWPTGPVSLLLFLFAGLLAILASIRGMLRRRVLSCKGCKGFGITRCRLCDGQGKVDWRAKFSYSEVVSHGRHAMRGI